MKVILQKYKISVQRYWNATLVGPDVRKFLLSHGPIIAELAGPGGRLRNFRSGIFSF
jgi:hypothetical protein